MNSIPNLPQSKYNAQKIALDWISKGVKPVPLRPRSKRPNAGDGWNKLRIKKDQVTEFFRRNDNVGALWGSPSGWLVDIDIDNDIACKLAPLLMPPTFIYGRKDRPASHYVYRCEGIGTIKCRTRALETIVEIRSTGTQSVLPPCRHPDGGYYNIDHDVDFSDIEPRALTRAVETLAAATVLVQRYPGSGGRHDYVHAVTGALLSCAWKPDRIVKFMDAVLSVASDEDPKQRGRTVRNTIDHFAKKDRIYGWNTLKTWVDETEVKSLQAWIGGTITISDAPADKPKKEKLNGAEKEYLLTPSKGTPMDKFKPAWLEVPGLVGDLIKYCESRSLSQQPVFHLAAALMSMALMTQNRYLVAGWDTPLQPYMMLVAPTAGGKESAMEATYTVARRLGLEDFIFQGFQSYHAMLDKLSQAPNMGVWIWDEAARFLKGSSKNASGPEHAVLTKVISIYGKANSYVPGIPARKNPIPKLDHPFFLVLGAAQPEALTASISDTEVTTGLINRFILFDSGSNFPPSNFNRQSTFPSKIEDYFRKMKELPVPGGEKPFIQINFDGNDSWSLFKEFEQHARKKAFDNENSLWSRANQNALIIAGIVAAGIESKRPKISIEVGRWAIDFVSWSCECWEYRLQKSRTRNVTEANSKKVEEIIRKAKQLSKTGRFRPSMLTLLEQGWVPKSILSRNCREIRGKELDEILTHLADMDLIAVTETENGALIYSAKD